MTTAELVERLQRAASLAFSIEEAGKRFSEMFGQAGVTIRDLAESLQQSDSSDTMTLVSPYRSKEDHT